MKARFVYVAAVLAAVSCDKSEQAAPAPMATQSAAPAPPPPPEKPWYTGNWSGKFDVRKQPVEAPKGVVREWEGDAGEVGLGAGTLALQIDEEGNVRGSSQGALGALSATGQAEASQVRVQLAPEEPGGFSGVLVLERSPGGAKGRLHTSTGDSLNVRVAEVELTKAADGIAPASPPKTPPGP